MKEQPPYTEEELSEFNDILDLCESHRQMDRIEGRMAMTPFIEKHGKEKCDAMFAALTKNPSPSGSDE